MFMFIVKFCPSIKICSNLDCLKKKNLFKNFLRTLIALATKKKNFVFRKVSLITFF